MLNAVHILLTYRCTDACRHCFVFAGPNQTASFSLSRLHRLLDQLPDLPSVRWVYFEGGEPFLYHPMLVEGVAHATRLGLATCAVTNGYWITSAQDLGPWLRPLVAAGLKKLQISVDRLHRYRRLEHLKQPILDACRDLRLTTQFLGVDLPEPNEEPAEMREGRTITGGEVVFRGRAVTQLVAEQATWLWSTFDECPHERLADPLRVHVDPHGYVHICQGTVIGNVDGDPLHRILDEYQPDEHAIVGPLLRGGPAALVTEYDLPHEEGYADACHLCYRAREQLQERFGDWLGPQAIYGSLEPPRRARRHAPPAASPAQDTAPAQKPEAETP